MRKYAQRISEFISRENQTKTIDLVWCQFKKEQILVTRVATDMNIPVMWTEHGPLPTKMFKLKPLLNAFKKQSQNAKHIIAVSEATKRSLVNAGIDEEKIEVIYNGVDLNRFSPRETARTSESDSRLTLGMVCRLSPEKGGSNFLQAIHLALQKRPQLNLRVIFCGDGRDKEHLLQLSSELGLSESVEFTGHRTDVEEVYRELDVSVSPSIGSEGLPLRVIESLACGVPVIASDVGGTKEIVQHGENGWLFQPGDVNALSDIIVSVGDNRAQLHALSQLARSTVERKFSDEKMMRHTYSCISRCIDN